MPDLMGWEPFSHKVDLVTLDRVAHSLFACTDNSIGSVRLVSECPIA